MAKVYALNGDEWGVSPAHSVSTPHHLPTQRKRCGSLQAQYAACCKAQSALEAEKALLIRLPKAKDDISPSGFIALKTLTKTSAGKGMRPQCHAECAALLDSNADLAAIMDWLEQMPGNWREEMALQALHDARSVQSVIGVRLKNVILFRSLLHALEAKRGARLMRLIEQGGRVHICQAISQALADHDVEYTPYQAVICGPWK